LVYAQPNIVVVLSDDAGYNDWGFMADLNSSSTEILTPNLDALAASATVMRQGYVCAGVCAPSRAGFLSGMYGQRFGFEDNPGPAQGLPANQQLISHYLQDLGYTTGAIGKWHLGETDGVNRPLDVGFDEFYGFFGGGRPFWSGYGDAERTLRRGNISIETQWGSEGDMSRYDPANGRYLTDAFGEEAADFINRHAGDEEPFFLYVALNAPHTPLQAKQSDLDLFQHIPDSNERLVAAMTYALDRAVGDINNALVANGIDDDTIVIFMNDNGGTQNPPAHDNYPLKGFKGSMWEGGIRVPMFIKAPGLAPGVYDQPVVSMDLVPTLLKMAGGDANQIDTDGVDILPYLEGQAAGSPHEVMFWRGVDGRFAVRKGDWKLTRPGTATFARLHNLAMDPSEDSYFNALYPEIVNELRRDLTNWEVTLEKAKWGAIGSTAYINLFDHFVFNGTTGNWSTSSVWWQAGTTNVATLQQWDSYANAILEFQVRNDASYTSTNNMVRATQLTFMLNELRFSGNYTGNGDRSGTINGNALLLVNSLEGAPATIRNDATSSTASSFGFNIDVELQLYHDLVFDGDGTQLLVVNGAVKDYYESRGVTKRGASRVVLAGNNLFTGDLLVEEGSMAAGNLSGALVVTGGRFEPLGVTNVGGDYLQTGGELAIELGLSSDRLVVSATASLAGKLDVSLADSFMPEIGQQFVILSASEIGGTFTELSLPLLDDGSWAVSYLSDSVLLQVTTLPGDFNADGGVDAADYVMWRKTGGTSLDYQDWKRNFAQFESNPAIPAADFNGDYVIDVADYVMWRKTNGSTADYNAWRSYFNHTTSAGARQNTSDQSVPEPSTLITHLAGTLLVLVAWPRRCARY
jgi:autotransporter-associated beta strand protein